MTWTGVMDRETIELELALLVEQERELLADVTDENGVRRPTPEHMAAFAALVNRQHPAVIRAFQRRAIARHEARASAPDAPVDLKFELIRRKTVEAELITRAAQVLAARRDDHWDELTPAEQDRYRGDVEALIEAGFVDIADFVLGGGGV